MDKNIIWQSLRRELEYAPVWLPIEPEQALFCFVTPSLMNSEEAALAAKIVASLQLEKAQSFNGCVGEKLPKSRFYVGFGLSSSEWSKIGCVDSSSQIQAAPLGELLLDSEKKKSLWSALKRALSQIVRD